MFIPQFENLSQVSLLHILTYTHKVTEGSWEWNLTTRETTAIFPLWNFHLAIFRHLHMACICLSLSLRWYDLLMPVVSIENLSKLQEEELPVVYLKSSFRSVPVATMTWLTVTEYLCHNWLYNKSLNIPKESSESVNRRRKEWQHCGQKKKDKQRSKKHTHKSKDRLKRIPLQPSVNSGAPFFVF